MKKLTGCFQKKKVCGNWFQTCYRLQVFLLPCDGNTAFLDDLDNYFGGFEELNNTMAANTTPRLDEQVLHLDLCACVKTTRCSVQTTSDTLIVWLWIEWRACSRSRLRTGSTVSPILYTLMSHDFYSKYTNNHKYKDTTTNNKQQQITGDWLIEETGPCTPQFTSRTLPWRLCSSKIWSLHTSTIAKRAHQSIGLISTRLSYRGATEKSVLTSSIALWSWEQQCLRQKGTEESG